ncbi:hypothetical protein EPN95_01275 [Patescibacteria group bacterium]|nr:MAG: hypothetical protein EPN95_01275 [Patescibacteria group bacterium]
MTSTVEAFYAIDFDRCLSDTDKLDKIFYTLADEEYPQLDAAELLRARNEVEDTGRTFDQIGALQKVFNESELADFLDVFINRAIKEDVLSPSARDFIKALESHNLQYGLVTFGGIRWQQVKIKASGVDSIPTLITDHTGKGEIIAKWQQADGTFLIPSDLTTKELYVKTVVLLDDKAIAFSGLPQAARGYWVQSTTKPLLPSQDGTVPGNVRIARGLEQVLDFESL